MESNNICLKYENVSIKINKIKDKDEKFLLKNINFEIKQNDIILMIGNSGSGKTTFLNILNNPFLEEYELNVKKKENINYNNNKIKMIPHMPLFNPYLTVDETFKLFKKHYNIKDTDNNIKLQFYTDFIMHHGKSNTLVGDSNNKTLSSGQLSELSICINILDEFDILILDEPFSNLDNYSSKRIMENIVKLNKN